MKARRRRCTCRSQSLPWGSYFCDPDKSWCRREIDVAWWRRIQGRKKMVQSFGDDAGGRKREPARVTRVKIRVAEYRYLHGVERIKNRYERALRRIAFGPYDPTSQEHGLFYDVQAIAIRVLKRHGIKAPKRRARRGEVPAPRVRGRVRR